MIKRLSGEYNRGYTQAIQDIIEMFNTLQSDLNFHHKRLNGKTVEEALNVFLMNREKFREHMGGFVRYNTVTKMLEYFQEGSR